MVHLRSIIFASILAVAASPTPDHAQKIPEKSRVPQRSDERINPADNPEVRSLLNDSEALPAEFASDVSLTLVENGFVRNAVVKHKVITRAFEKAAAAEDDVMRRPFGASVEETSQGLHAIASSVTRLNRISLQARVIQQFVATDPREARQLFESMHPPQLTSVSCIENWYFVPDAYYDALLQVLQHGFSDREIRGGTRAAYAISVVRRTQWHVQLVPVARLLSAGDFTEQELRTTVPVFAAVLADVHEDPLPFSTLMSNPKSFFEGFTSLFTTLDKHNLDTRALLQALRDYLVLNFKEPHCGPTVAPSDSTSTLPSAIVQFNETFGSRLKRLSLGIIGDDQIKSDIKTSVPEQPLPSRWNSLAYSQLVESVQKLNTPLTKKELDEGRTDNDAQRMSQVQDVLTRLSAWSNEGQSDADFFHQKAILLEALVQRTVGTPLHAEVLDAFVHFLEQNSYQEITPVDWFFCAKIILARTAGLNSADADLRRLIDSREPVLNVYARLQSLLLSAKQTPTGKSSSERTNR